MRVPHPRSDHSHGIALVLGVLAAALAVAECVTAIILLNRPAIAAAIGLPESGAVWVTLAAIVIITVVVVTVVVGLLPRGALRSERRNRATTFDANRVGLQ
jgi:hypothetical protein